MASYLKNVDIDLYKQRLIVVVLLVAAAFALLMARLVFLQVIGGETYRRLSENNCIRLQDIDPDRGLVFDRNGKQIVDNRPAFDLSIVPRDAGNVHDTLASISRLTGLPLEQLEKNYNENRVGGAFQPVVLAQDVGRDILAVLEGHKFDLPGAKVDFKPRRYYLYQGLASHLIGYLGEVSRQELAGRRHAGYKPGDFIGKTGAERTYDQFLRGERGGRQVEVNAAGQTVRVLQTVPARPGHNLYLTIDFTLQKTAEELFKGKTGAAVAMDPFSGDVLAMVSSPAFDQNAFVDGISRQEWDLLLADPQKPLQNKVIQAEYPPGSIYKMIPAMAGLEERVVDHQTSFHCPGSYRLGDRAFRCWRREGHGAMNMVEALSQSCDVYFYNVGRALGVERLAWYARACGLGKPTGIDLGAEASGLVPSSRWKERRFGEPWMGGETLNVVIGQGYNLVTPLQMAVFVSAFANGGTIKKPVILDRLETVEGEVILRGETIDRGYLPIRQAETLPIVLQGMWQVVNDKRGTAWYTVHSKAYDISGKTGTAQVAASPEGKDEETDRPHFLKPHAWFVAFAPSDAPRIAVAVIVEHGEAGSKIAGPIARDMIAAYLAGDGS